MVKLLLLQQLNIEHMQEITLALKSFQKNYAVSLFLEDPNGLDAIISQIL